MTKKYDFVNRDDLVMTSVKIRVIRKHKNNAKRQRFWVSKGWHYSRGNLIYPFPRWIKRIRRELVWAASCEDTHTYQIWRFERAARYRWWFSVTPKGYHYGEWMEQGICQAGASLLNKIFFSRDVKERE